MKKLLCSRALWLNFVLIFCSGIANAQWVPEIRKGGLIISQRFSYSSSYYDANGKTISAANNGEFLKYELGGWLTVGIGDGWAMVSGFSLAAQEYSDDNVNKKSAGFTNPSIGLIKQITYWPDPFIFAMGYSVVLPLRYPSGAVPDLGGNFFENEVNAILSRGFDSFYLNSTVGYRYKANDLKESEWKFIFGGGVTLSEDFDFFSALEYIYVANVKRNSFKVSGTAVYKANENIGISLGSEYITSGANVGLGPTIVSGLWLSF